MDNETRMHAKQKVYSMKRYIQSLWMDWKPYNYNDYYENVALFKYWNFFSVEYFYDYVIL